MDFTRRDLSLLLPALFAPQGEGQHDVLPSKCYAFDELAAKTDSKTHNEARQVFDGLTHSGVPLEVHITTLAPGQMPHAAHHHVHEEMIFIQEGMVEVTILDKSSRIGPGSVAYVKSNEEHGWKNVGDGPARYFVLAVGKEKAG